ncbi:MAG: PQQ-dependent sugar dehydrogenase [Planctomycetota bacterium]|jgi:glucose/arabinose dehydrogenase
MSASTILLIATLVTALPPGFSSHEVVNGLFQPTSMRFLPDGRLLIAERRGELLVVDPFAGTPAVTSYMTVPGVCNQPWRGVLGLAVHPQFSTNHTFYVYSCHDPSGRFRISSFVEGAGVGRPNSEVVIWESPVDSSLGDSHFGGGLDFVPDGNLYLTTGDQDHPDCAPDPTSPLGKVLCIQPDGTAPESNPFADGPGGNDDFVWAIGLRNPFRARWDLDTGRYFIGEVGPSTWEDIHLGAAGADYGWPQCVGPCASGPGGPCPCKGIDAPIFSYAHGGSAMVVGGFVYRGDLFPSDPYDGAYFFADGSQQWIRYLTFDGSGTTVTGDFEFQPGIPGLIVELIEGPDGALYHLRYGGSAHRTVYDDGLAAPVIIETSASPLTGPAPLEVTLHAAASDGDDESLSYLWLLGDGQTADGADVVHTYDVGTHFARVAVSDGVHTTLSPAIMIQAGQAPEVEITAPRAGLFRAGDVIELAAVATDPDDPIESLEFDWRVVFFNGSATIDVLHSLETSPSLGVPVTGLPMTETSGLQITLTITDRGGLSATDSVVLEPEVVELTFSAVPDGLTFLVDGAATTVMTSMPALVQAEIPVYAPAQCVGQDLYNLASWSDGGAALHTVIVPERDQRYVATYELGDDPASDFDVNGVINVDDLLVIILGWGPCVAG